MTTTSDDEPPNENPLPECASPGTGDAAAASRHPTAPPSSASPAPAPATLRKSRREGVETLESSAMAGLTHGWKVAAIIAAGWLDGKRGGTLSRAAIRWHDQAVRSPAGCGARLTTPRRASLLVFWIADPTDLSDP